MSRPLLLQTGVILALLAALGYAGMPLLLYSWDAFVQYQSPYWEPLPRNPIPSPPPMTERVVIVMIDGLRYDTSLTMPFLNRLRTEGADFEATVGEPSLSLPGWTALATGAWQEVSGVTTNWYEGTVQVESIFSEAQEAGLRTAIVGTESWGQLFDPWLDSFDLIPGPGDETDPAQIEATDNASLAAAVRVLDGSVAEPDLVLIYFPGPDEYGHAFGAASSFYRESALKIDARVERLVQALDLQTASLLITSDHGHLDAGGHGGREPEVITVPLILVGKGFRAGVSGAAWQADIAPTVSALLGIAIPGNSQGAPLLNALDASQEQVVDIANAAHWQLFMVSDMRARVLGRPDSVSPLMPFSKHPQFAMPVEQMDAALRLLGPRAEEARAQRIWSDRLLRLFPALIFGLLGPGYFGFLVGKGPRSRWLIPGACALVYFGLYWGAYFASGATLSLSVFNSESQIESLLGARVLAAASGLGMVALVSGLAAGGQPARVAIRMVSDALILIAGAVTSQMSLFYWLWGLRFPHYLPDTRWALKYYLDGLQLTAFYLPLPGLPEWVGIPTALAAWGLALAAWAAASRLMASRALRR